MFKNSHFKQLTLVSAGFTLIEVQIYLSVMVVIAVMVCQVALMYHNVYDNISVSCQNSINMLAAIFKVNESFDNTLFYHKKTGQPCRSAFFKKNKLLGIFNNRQTVLLEDVSHFNEQLDSKNNLIRGASFTCDYKSKKITWYRASVIKAYSCS